MMEVEFGIRFLDVMPGVWGAIQRGQGSAGEPIDLKKLTGGEAEWSVSVTLKDGKPTGKFVQKDAKGAFIYILWGTRAGQPMTQIGRRAKVYLPKELEGGARYVAELEGRDKLGFPVCATVHPRSGWKRSGTF